MTKSKREPFAVISYCIEADENALSVGNQTVAGDGKHGFDHVALVDICKRINAAFNARVDEEVRKAVEEFRERAARSVEVADLFEDVENGCPAEMPEATRPGFSAVGWIAKKIRALPTEPEGK